MRIIIAPAKKMVVDTDSFAVDGLPQFLERTERLKTVLQGMSPKDLQALWKCNDAIAKLNVERLEQMDLRRNLTPAVLSYEGIQYRYMAPGVMETIHLDYLREHLRILSGFYGLLRPFDGVTPYRLEMQAKLAVDGCRDLYQFWGSRLARQLASETDVVLNLASKEYSKAVEAYLPKTVRFVTCAFGELKDGKVVKREGHCTASLQIISRDQAWWLEYPKAQLQVSRQPFQVQIGQSSFGSQGIDFHIQQDNLSLCGSLRYGPFTALRSDIMGPFRFFAGMQCSHGVISMGHSLSGALELNGERLDFSDGIGYIETDRGRSFPTKYLWTQCVWDGPEHGSLMLAIATIPLPVGGFTGCICSVFYGGREYRLATYRGVRIEAWSSADAVIRQGKYRLEAELLNERRQPLRAPVEGRMERTIHESLCVEVRYRFWHGDDLLFQRTDPNASFEYSSAD